MTIGKFARYWLPAIIWMGYIFWFSTDTFSARHTAGIIEPALRFVYPDISDQALKLIHMLIRKMAHVSEYALLSFLIFRALRQDRPTRWTGRWALLAQLIVMGYALSDEGHQAFTAERGASGFDVGLDSLGGLIMQVYLAIYYRIKGPGPAMHNAPSDRLDQKIRGRETGAGASGNP